MADLNYDNEKDVKPQVSAGSELDNGQRSEAFLEAGTVAKITRTSSIFMVLIAGLALFSDGYNAQVAIMSFGTKILLRYQIGYWIYESSLYTTVPGYLHQNT
jgi:hypothetical protein